MDCTMIHQAIELATKMAAHVGFGCNDEKFARIHLLFVQLLNIWKDAAQEIGSSLEVLEIVWYFSQEINNYSALSGIVNRIRNEDDQTKSNENFSNNASVVELPNDETRINTPLNSVLSGPSLGFTDNDNSSSVMSPTPSIIALASPGFFLHFQIFVFTNEKFFKKLYYKLVQKID